MALHNVPMPSLKHIGQVSQPNGARGIALARARTDTEDGWSYTTVDVQIEDRVANICAQRTRCLRPTELTEHLVASRLPRTRGCFASPSHQPFGSGPDQSPHPGAMPTRSWPMRTSSSMVQNRLVFGRGEVLPTAVSSAPRQHGEIHFASYRNRTLLRGHSVRVRVECRPDLHVPG